jgi:MFS family permease
LDPSGVFVGFVVSAWFLSRVFIELPAGIISDRIGRRKLLITGVGLCALAYSALPADHRDLMPDPAHILFEPLLLFSQLILSFLHRNLLFQNPSPFIYFIRVYAFFRNKKNVQ